MKRKVQQGYSLIEVLIAMALLGTVLLSIITLFFFGRSNVYSGKQMTQAVAVGTRVMEDFADLSRSDVISKFAIGGNALGDVTVGGTTYGNSTSVNTSMGTPPAYVAQWATLMAAERFLSGKVTVVFTPIDPLAGGAPTLAAAPILRIRAVIEWSEAKRARRIVVDTTKVDRAL